MTATDVATSEKTTEEPPRPKTSKEDRWGWLGVGAITLALAATWIPRLNLPFGDNHMGRIISRYALHLANLHEKGIVGSDFSADWQPYADSAYAHHPPLLNILTALFGSFPGDQPIEVWISPYLLALLIVPAGALLLRGLGLRWSATLLAVGLMGSTTFFWVYAPIMFDLGPILLISAVVVIARRKDYQPSRGLLAVGVVAGLLSTLVSWPGIGFAGAMGLWLLIGRRRIDRVVLWIGGAMVVGLAISLTFIVGVSGIADLTNQAEFRTQGGTFTARQFVGRQVNYLDTLLPIWYLVLLVVGTVAGLLDKRTRLFMAFAVVFQGFWTIILNNGAFIHEYWNYPVLILGLVGMGALLDRAISWLGTRVPSRAMLVGTAAAGLALVAALAVIVTGRVNRVYVDEPTDVGTLVSKNDPGPGQEFAWIAGGGLSTPRWYAYYWNLEPESVTPEVLDGTTAKPTDLVLMDLRRVPKWLPKNIGDRASAKDGDYALVKMSDLKSAEINP
ncbi:hypothetical protein SAMN05421812_102114 [Asanoa hainanensis]|uniref:Dolichyl-phosphate-mannose-protein mannosyltransferase n=1 Tax=Asanoa hainanensis TaxID=560556 RepID=A0A239I0G0_9ACTN|nr:hypothetical protein [Asanoa hainanensis]SNS86513.1 hypothetical protein SAMN05421812_102114 [Asanoa hainanensis]